MQGDVTNWHQLCLEECLKKMQKDAYAYIFHNPVLEAPPNEVPELIKEQYKKMIKHPMDYRTITENLSEYRYTDPEHFVAHMLSIYENCMLFNPDHGESKWLHQAAKRNKGQFIRLWNKLKPKVINACKASGEAKTRSKEVAAPVVYRQPSSSNTSKRSAHYRERPSNFEVAAPPLFRIVPPSTSHDDPRGPANVVVAPQNTLENSDGLNSTTKSLVDTTWNAVNDEVNEVSNQSFQTMKQLNSMSDPLAASSDFVRSNYSRVDTPSDQAHPDAIYHTPSNGMDVHLPKDGGSYSKLPQSEHDTIKDSFEGSTVEAAYTLGEQKQMSYTSPMDGMEGAADDSASVTKSEFSIRLVDPYNHEKWKAHTSKDARKKHKDKSLKKNRRKREEANEQYPLQEPYFPYVSDPSGDGTTQYRGREEQHHMGGIQGEAKSTLTANSSLLRIPMKRETLDDITSPTVGTSNQVLKPASSKGAVTESVGRLLGKGRTLGWQGTDGYSRRRKKSKAKMLEAGSSDEETDVLQDIIAEYKSRIKASSYAVSNADNKMERDMTCAESATEKAEAATAMNETSNDVPITPVEADTTEDSTDAAPKSLSSFISFRLQKKELNTMNSRSVLHDVFYVNGNEAKSLEGATSETISDVSPTSIKQPVQHNMPNSIAKLFNGQPSYSNTSLKSQLEEAYAMLLRNEKAILLKNAVEPNAAIEKESFLSAIFTVHPSTMRPNVSISDDKCFDLRTSLQNSSFMSISSIPSIPVSSLEYHNLPAAIAVAADYSLSRSFLLRFNAANLDADIVNLQAHHAAVVNEDPQIAEELKSGERVMHVENDWIKVETFQVDNNLPTEFTENQLDDNPLPFDLYYSKVSFVFQPCPSGSNQQIVNLYLLQPFNTYEFDKTKFFASSMNCQPNASNVSPPVNSCGNIINGKSSYRYLWKINQMYHEGNALLQSDPRLQSACQHQSAIFGIMHRLEAFFREDAAPNYNQEMDFLWYVSLSAEDFMVLGLLAVPVLTLHILHTFSPQLLTYLSKNGNSESTDLMLIMGRDSNVSSANQ